MPFATSKFKKITPTMTFSAVIVAQTMVLAAAFAASQETAPLGHALLIPAVAVLASLLACFFHHEGWHALLIAFLIGLGVGDISVMSMVSEPIEGLFVVSTSTVIFFTVLGMSVGTVAELVRFCHYLVHGGKLKLYPWGKKQKN
jgi:hypothetical protein